MELAGSVEVGPCAPQVLQCFSIQSASSLVSSPDLMVLDRFKQDRFKQARTQKSQVPKRSSLQKR